ncbi:hypothetical protein LIER_42797 [Lithospermum erythrorhizon]|uniref:Uncharacterized protein n=1 Tax=Lithospermum erythrorhizon TaxID=34254 RepID=A0AAV3NY62_LITER
MMVADESMMVKVMAIDKVVKRILQTTSANIFKLSQLDQSYDVNSLSSELEGKTFLMLLHRTFSQQNERKRKLMLLYYIAVNSHSSTQDISPSSSSASEKGKAAEIPHSPLSPLKRRLSEITLYADIYTSTSKKNLSMAESDDANENTNSKA